MESMTFPSDYVVETYHVNKIGFEQAILAVRLTHKPTGLKVESDSERSFWRNVKRAIELMNKKLPDKYTKLPGLAKAEKECAEQLTRNTCMPPKKKPHIYLDGHYWRVSSSKAPHEPFVKAHQFTQRLNNNIKRFDIPTLKSELNKAFEKIHAPLVQFELGFTVEWICSNPELFEQRFNKFFDDYAKDYVITSNVSKGCIILHAKRK